MLRLLETTVPIESVSIANAPARENRPALWTEHLSLVVSLQLSEHRLIEKSHGDL